MYVLRGSSMQQYAAERPDNVAVFTAEEAEIVQALPAMLEDAALDAAKHAWKRVCCQA